MSVLRVVGGPAAAILLASFGCHSGRVDESLSPAVRDAASEHAAIDSLRNRLEASFSSGDLEGMASVYADDAAFSAPGYPIVHGREEIRRIFELKRPPGGRATFQPVETRILTPEWAYEFGKLTVEARVGPDQRLIRGESTYLVILRKYSAGWRVYRETLSSNEPAARPR